MNAKEYLGQVQKLDKMISNKIIEVEQWKTIAAGTTARSEGERVQSSGSQQKMADAVCKYVSIQKEVDADIDRLIDIKKDVIKTIEKLPATEYDVAHKLYIGIVVDDEHGKHVHYLSLDEVAAIYMKSVAWVKSVRGRVLKRVQNILNERRREGHDGF